MNNRAAGAFLLGLLVPLFLAWNPGGDAADGWSSGDEVTATLMGGLETALDAVETAQAADDTRLDGIEAAGALVGTANGGFTGEIPVGTIPGGELGNTWASPTIDDGISILNLSTTGTLVVPFAATPTTDADGELAIDQDVLNGTRDAIEVYDGTASTYVVATLATSTPSNGQVPKYTDGTVTWENESTGGVEFDSGNNGGSDTLANEISITNDTHNICSLSSNDLVCNFTLLEPLGYVVGGDAVIDSLLIVEGGDTPSDNQTLVWHGGASGYADWQDQGEVTAGVASAGDCTGGACFDGTSDGGSQLTLYDAAATIVIDNAAGALDVSRPVTSTSYTADDPGDGTRGLLLQDNSAACEDPALGSTSICTIGGRAYVRDSGLSSFRMPVVVASGSVALDTDAIASTACDTSDTSIAASGVLTTDVISWTPSTDISTVTGYAPATTGALIVYVYPTSNAVSFKVCNPTSSSITPGSAVTVNWRVVR